MFGGDFEMFYLGFWRFLNVFGDFGMFLGFYWGFWNIF
jgi:hypothetical protein